MMALTMWRLVAKLLFKASLPLTLVVGALSYGLYMQGGDPGAVLRSVAGNAMQSATSAARNATNSVSGSLDSLKPGDAIEASNAISEFYTWVDENGVTHYSSEPPADRSTDTVTVDANTNIIVSLPSGQPHDNQDTNFDITGNPDVAGGAGPGAATGHPQPMMPDGSRLPGMAGIVLPDGVNPQSLVELLQSRQH